MQGEKFKIAMMLGGLCVSFTTAFASSNIDVKQFRTHPLDKQYSIAGAHGFDSVFFTVNNRDSKIYKLSFESGETKSKLTPYKDLSNPDIYGNYTVGKSSGKNGDFNLEGVTFCKAPQNSSYGFTFYLVNGKTGDILKLQGNSLQKLDIDYENFPDYKYEVGNDGFMGVSMDCTSSTLFVAKQKNPNIVFAIDLGAKVVTHSYDLSTGSDSEDDISDLFFTDEKLYVLQKNISMIQVIQPKASDPKQVSVFKRPQTLLQTIDYSVTSNLTMSSPETGNAESLIKNNNSIFLFLNQSSSIIELQLPAS